MSSSVQVVDFSQLQTRLRLRDYLLMPVWLLLLPIFVAWDVLGGWYYRRKGINFYMGHEWPEISSDIFGQCDFALCALGIKRKALRNRGTPYYVRLIRLRLSIFFAALIRHFLALPRLVLLCADVAHAKRSIDVCQILRWLSDYLVLRRLGSATAV